MEYESLNGKIALMFPGVGSEYFNMGEELYKNYSIVRQTFEEASDAINVDLFKICFQENDGKIKKLEYAKPALVCLSVATYKLYMEYLGIKPKCCIGYSLGEYSALCCAGILKFKDTLDIVRKRAIIINNVVSKQNGTMAWSINVKKNVIEKFCNEALESGYDVYISAYDSETKLSVSGTIKGIEYLATKVEDAGGIIIPIKMSGPFHSPLMSEAAKELRSILKGYEFNDPKYAVLANRNANMYTNNKEEIIENLSMQLCEPVLWDKTLQVAIKNGIEYAIELGPKNVLKYLLEINTSKIKAYSIEKTEHMNLLLNDLTNGKSVSNSLPKSISY